MKKFLQCIWYVLRLRCEEADRIRTCACVGEATRTERFAEWLHRLACGACRRVRKQLMVVEEGLQDLEEEVQGGQVEALSAEGRARVLAGVQKKTEEGVRD